MEISVATKFSPIVTDLIDGFDKRRWSRKPSLIVIHHTDVGGKILKLMDKAKRMAMHNAIARYLGAADRVYVSAHFQIGYEGQITQIIDPRTHVAFHAGNSQWYDAHSKQVLAGCNNFSVGIELLGDGNIQPYAKEQIDSLIILIQELVAKVPGLSLENIAGHQDIAPKRKVDPGKFFPWAELETRLGVRIKRTNWGRP